MLRSYQGSGRRPAGTGTINDQVWPNIDPLMVKHGQRYRIAFRNGMEDSHCHMQ